MKRETRPADEPKGDSFVDMRVLARTGSFYMTKPKVRKEPKVGRRATSGRRHQTNGLQGTMVTGNAAPAMQRLFVPYVYGKSSAQARAKVQQAYDEWFKTLTPHEQAQLTIRKGAR